jgi:long-subunit acyl-CoA synthetase (AMP-forming)
VFLAADGLDRSGVNGSDPHRNPPIRAEIGRGIRDQVNPRFARVEQVRDIEILPGELTIDSGDLTATMKLRRSVVTTRHASLIDAMYARDTQSLLAERAGDVTTRLG